MNKKILKPVVLTLVFLAALVIFSITANKENADMTTTMSEATLPVMYFYNGDIKIDELHGYVNEMDGTLMRDSIIPMSNERKLSISISTYGTPVDSISYEVRSIDGERLVTESEISDFIIEENQITSEITVANALENNQEYMIIFKLENGQNEYFYYARLMQTSDYNVDETLKFALDFHNKTLSKDDKAFFSTYMETTTGDRETLDYVDLSCTVNQITWGKFAGKQFMDPIVSFKEINASYNVITVNYVMTNTNEAGEIEYYNVEEYFRLRKTNERMYVLNYERTAEQLFNTENNFLDESSNIKLGIRNNQIDFKTNEAETIVGFVQQGELFSYNLNNNEITRIFTFRDSEGFDIRENWNQHDIKIIRVDEAGSIDFVVYGYMNRGDHEGEVGTAVYHFDGLARTVEEEVFIPSRASYEVVKAEMGKLLYVTDEGSLYLMTEGDVCKINLDTLKVEKIVENLNEGCYCVSESNRYFSWVNSDEKYSSTNLNLMDLKTGKSWTIDKGDGYYVQPLGFIDEDFIFGTANSSDVLTDAAGNVTFPMKELTIYDTDKKQDIKKYEPSGSVVEDISIDNYTITVKLIVASGGAYVDAGNDTIMNREADVSDKVYIVPVSLDDKMRTQTIEISANPDSSSTKQLTAQAVMNEKKKNIDFKKDKQNNHFYVYAKGKVLLSTDSSSDAITLANEKQGVVVDGSQHYVWMRARKNAVTPFAGVEPNPTDANSDVIVKAVSSILTYSNQSISVSEQVNLGTSAGEVMRNTLSDKTVLDLKGIKTEDIIFYVSQGNPVFAMTGANSAVVVTGYTSNGILYYYDPMTGKTESKSFADADNMFYGGGYHFITYME